MKVSRRTIERYETTDRATGRRVVRYRVRWRVKLPTGEWRQCKRSGFERKGLAEAYSDRVRDAELGLDGWSLDSSGYPVGPEQPVVGAERPETVFEAAEVFVAAHWAHQWRSEATKVKNRGRLLILVATLVDDQGAAARLLVGLEQQQANRGKRPPPTTTEEWVACYLRDRALDPTWQPDPNATPTPEVDAELTAARDWLLKHSLPLAALDDTHLLRLRSHICDGRTYNTARTYWNTTKTFLAWLVRSGRLERNPAAGLPDLRRDLDSDVVDVDRVPTEDEIWTIADSMLEPFGEVPRLFTLATFYGALRIAETVGLRRRDVTFTPTGGAWITVSAQHQVVQRRYSADGSTAARRPPKGRSDGPRARRRIYLPGRVARLVAAHLTALGSDDKDAPLFPGIESERLTADTYRRRCWAPTIAGLYTGHRLEGITPHAMRHGGMTMWLRNGIPLKTCQKWGGWHSLKVMLDTYAAALPDDDDVAVECLEAAAPVADAA